MRRFSICILFIFLVFCFGRTKGVTFFTGSWEEAVLKARMENKAIFADIYTDWCLPCKKMDKNVFTDSILGTDFNRHFISIKINAEDGSWGEDISRSYDIGAYPSLLFIHVDGELLIKNVGYQNAEDLRTAGKEAVLLNENFSRIQNFRKHADIPYSLIELEDILTISKNYSFSEKTLFISKFLEMKEALNENDLSLIMNEVDHFDLDILERITPLTTNLSKAEIAVRRNPRERRKWKSDTHLAVMNKIKEYIRAGDYPLFNHCIEILKTVRTTSRKDVDWLYFDFYRSNDLSKYKTFATYMITEYILPATPEEVRITDFAKYKMLHSAELYTQAEVIFSYSNVIDESSTNPENSKTPTLDSLSEIYTISLNIANKLYNISSDFYAFYDDNVSSANAEKWAALACKYYPYDLKFYENHLTILYGLGSAEKIRGVKNYFKNLDYYDEMIIKKEEAKKSMLFLQE